MIECTTVSVRSLYRLHWRPVIRYQAGAGMEAGTYRPGRGSSSVAWQLADETRSSATGAWGVRGTSAGHWKALMIASAAAVGAWTGPIRSAQLNQYHQSPVVRSGVAITSPQSARLCGSCTHR